jgi:hypothetical protein
LRRWWDSWHQWAGQDFRDRTDSDAKRFRDSFGVDVWERDTLSLLPATTHVVTSAATNLQLCVAGDYAYVLDGTGVKVSGDGVAWSAATGTSGITQIGIVQDGQYVYVTDGTAIFRASPGGAFSSWNTLDASLLGWCNGRLMAAGNGASQNAIYNVIDATLPTALFTYPSTGWTWTAFASGPSCIYASGYVGDRSLIYKIDIKADGTGLDIPIAAFEFPEGEQCLSMASYLGYLVAGTSAGMRLLNMGDTLTAGPPLAVPAVHCLEPQDRYVWFGWTNYDANYTGLGRASLVPGIDQSAFTDTLTPAYASDLMAASGTHGNVVSVATYNDRRLFSVSGSGVWLESATDLTPTGTLYTGWVTYGLPDLKVYESIEVRMAPLDGTISLAVTTPDDAPIDLTPVIELHDSTSALVWARERSADRAEIAITLNRESLDHTLGPEITRLTLFAVAAPLRSSTWQLPLLLAERVELVPQNTYRRYEAQVEREYLTLQCESASLVTVQIGRMSFNGVVTDWEWHPSHRYVDNADWSGTLLLTVKVPRQNQF